MEIHLTNGPLDINQNLKDEKLIECRRKNAILFYRLFRDCVSKMRDEGLPIDGMIPDFERDSETADKFIAAVELVLSE